MNTTRPCSLDIFPSLKEIPNPPKKLFIKGQDTFTNKIFLTVVGTRTPTEYGQHMCKTIIQQLAPYPIVIVSGLAHGIDACAHKAALLYNIPTIAIPGSGLNDDVLYPRAHLTLAHNIIDAGGALVSEFDSDTRAAPYTFPKRNRIMAGISMYTLIVECTKKSGTLITAKLATDFNRTVMTIPQSLTSMYGEGPFKLLQMGAVPIRSGNCVLEAMDIDIKENITQQYTHLTPKEQKIIAILQHPKSRNELLHTSPFSVVETQSIITSLLLQGMIDEIDKKLILNTIAQK